MPRSKSKKKSSLKPIDEISTESDFEENIMTINIKKPKRAYNFFITEMMQKHKIKKIGEATKRYAPEWRELSDKEAEKYFKMEDDDIDRYKKHMALVKKYILEKPPGENATAYSLFKDSYIANAIEEGIDIREARETAREKWDKLSGKEKEEWEEKKNDNQDLYDELKTFKPGNISAQTAFIKDRVLQGDTFKEASIKWKDASKEIRDRYADYADELNQAKKKKRDIWEMAYGIKPRRPTGTYALFVAEQSRLGKFSGKSVMREASRIWHNLNELEKLRYKKVQRKLSLAYQIKMAQFKVYKRGLSSTRTSSSYNLYVKDNAHKYEDKKLQRGELLQLISKDWAKEPEKVKKSYEKMALNLKKESKEESERIFDKPKKNPNSYNLYIKERMPILNKKHSQKDVQEIMKMIADEWNDLSDKAKQKYYDMEDDLKDKYLRKIEEFEKYGYYKEDHNVPKRKRSQTSQKQSKRRDSGKSVRDDDRSQRSNKSSRVNTPQKNKKRGRSRR